MFNYFRTVGKTVLFLLLFNTTVLYSQEKILDYNTIYQFPLSLGVEYQSLNPFGSYGVDVISANEISAVLRYPLPFISVLQPSFHCGVIPFITDDPDHPEDPDRWNHTHWFAALGMSYAHRFSKNFEVGADFAIGVSEAVFPNIDPVESRGSPNLFASVGGKVSLDPSYSMNIDVHPTLRYFYSLTPLTKFNGLVFGLGFSVNYRFGEDPDSPQAIIRSIKYGEVSMPPLFAAMQNYYVKNPIGQVTITNKEKFSIVDVDVSFFQPVFMDTPTKALTIPELLPGESREIDLFASFNGDVFTTEGITPLTGEIIVDYVARGRAAHQSSSVSFDLHDKEALTWDDDRKVAALITPQDSALRNYTSTVRQYCKEEEATGLSDFLQAGMEIFYALAEIGIIYQVDPTSPFTSFQGNPLTVDSVSLPRNTLTRLTGDCDDLTVLYCSLLETLGIETAFITVPGHIFAAFNTNVPSHSYRIVHPDKNMTLNIEGRLWVPVEITMIGTASFLEAWRTGIEEFKALDGSPEKRVFNFTKKAHEVYRPVGLRETDLGLQYGNKKEIVGNFNADKEKLIDTIIDSHLAGARESGKKTQYNKLGITCAEFGRYIEAGKAFNTALSLDRNYFDPKINLGTLYYMQGEYQAALSIFHSIEKLFEEKDRTTGPTYLQVLLNISRSYYELENYDKASSYFDKIIIIDPSKEEQFSYLQSSGGETKAARIGSFTSLLFADEEE